MSKRCRYDGDDEGDKEGYTYVPPFELYRQQTHMAFLLWAQIGPIETKTTRTQGQGVEGETYAQHEIDRNAGDEVVDTVISDCFMALHLRGSHSRAHGDNLPVHDNFTSDRGRAEDGLM